MASTHIIELGVQNPDGVEIKFKYRFILSEEAFNEIKDIAVEQGKALDEIELDDLPRYIQKLIKGTLEKDWGFVDGESYNAIVNGFSINETMITE